jgi:sulfide:quinone oxidoreductase
VVIAGGGVGALEAMIALQATASERLTVTLVSAAEIFTYRPLLIGEPFGLGHPARYRVDELCRDNDARFVNASVAAVAPDDHRVVLDDRTELEYDTLIVAVGARMVPTFEYGVTFDRETSPEDFAEVLADLGEGIAPRVAMVVPDTVSWALPAYELALMTAAWGAAEHPDQLSVRVVTHEPRPLAAFGRTVSDAVDRLLTAAGVTAECGVHPDMLSHTALRAGGHWVETDRVVCLPHLSGPRLSGLPCDQGGFIPVDDVGRVRGVADVYAAGDATTVPIKQGGLAAQLADVATRHIVAGLAGLGGSPEAQAEVEAFRPVLRGVLRTADGPRYLRAELADVEGTSTISDEPLWWPPSKISSRWLAPYLGRLESPGQPGEPGSGTPAG